MRRHVRLALLYVLAWLARPGTRRARGAPARVLYINPGHLGDLLLALPVLDELRARLPHAQLTALVGPWALEVVARHPVLDALLTCPFPAFTRSARPPLWQPYALLLQYALQLRACRFDAALIGRDDHWWGAALALLAGVPRRVGYAVAECRPFLTTALDYNPHDHVTRQGLALVAALAGQEPQGQGVAPTRFVPADDDQAWAHAQLASRGLHTPVIIHPGTGGPAKLWPVDHWVAVAQALQAQGLAVLVTAGPGELPLATRIAQGCRPALPVLEVAGIGRLAAVFRQAQTVLGVDSGGMHVAAQQPVATVHLYGPGDAGRFGPWGESARHQVVTAELWCRPCGVFSHCPRGTTGPECMARITPEQVLAVLGR